MKIDFHLKTYAARDRFYSSEVITTNERLLLLAPPFAKDSSLFSFFFSFLFFIIIIISTFHIGKLLYGRMAGEEFRSQTHPVCLPGDTIRSAIKGRTRGSVNISELSKSASSPLSKASRDFNRTEQSRAHPSYIYEIDIKHRVLQPQPLSVPKPPTIRLHLYLCMTQAAHAGQIAFDRRPKFLPLFYTPIRPPISSSHSYFSLLRNNTFRCYATFNLPSVSYFATLIFYILKPMELWLSAMPTLWEWV